MPGYWIRARGSRTTRRCAAGAVGAAVDRWRSGHGTGSSRLERVDRRTSATSTRFFDPGPTSRGSGRARLDRLPAVRRGHRRRAPVTDLAADEGVLLAPGRMFGRDDGHVRLGFGRENLPVALEHLGVSRAPSWRPMRRVVILVGPTGPGRRRRLRARHQAGRPVRRDRRGTTVRAGSRPRYDRSAARGVDRRALIAGSSASPTWHRGMGS